ncbi:hypothetical protein [Streptomyces sp. SD15]
MTSVSDAVESCAGGFQATAKGETEKFTKVEAEKASGSGDESVAFAVTGDADADGIVVHGEVVRHGSTVATYYSLSVADELRFPRRSWVFLDRGKRPVVHGWVSLRMTLAAFAEDEAATEYDVPDELIKAQADKLA